MLLAAAVAQAEAYEARGSLVLADFEGEMLGHGGEMTVAVFRSISGCGPAIQGPLGLIVDLRSCRCAVVLKTIMESPRITKLMWGAEQDFQSMLHQVVPVALRVQPANVVDMQLAFSTDEKHRLGMARMLDRIPSELVGPLPPKDSIDWDKWHSRNCRALHLPLDQTAATYTMDDLHRLEAILLTQWPPNASYEGARSTTERVLAEIKCDPHGLHALEKNAERLPRLNDETKIQVQAVKLMRHVLSIRATSDGLGLDEDQEKLVATVTTMATNVLDKRGVSIPNDLSFYDREGAEELAPDEAAKDGSIATASGSGSTLRIAPDISFAPDALPELICKFFPWVHMSAQIQLQ